MRGLALRGRLISRGRHRKRHTLANWSGLADEVSGRGDVALVTNPRQSIILDGCVARSGRWKTPGQTHARTHAIPRCQPRWPVVAGGFSIAPDECSLPCANSLLLECQPQPRAIRHSSMVPHVSLLSLRPSFAHGLRLKSSDSCLLETSTPAPIVVPCSGVETHPVAAIAGERPSVPSSQ